MTSNQLAYQNLQEQARANREKEAENKRSNQAKEAENYRSNLARETETARSNLVKEAETERANRMDEDISKYELREKQRHNVISELTDAAKTFVQWQGNVTAGIGNVAKLVGLFA